MSAKVQFVAEMSAEKVHAAITKLEEKVGNLEAKNRQLRQSSVKGSDDATKGMLSLDRTLGKVIAGATSAGAAFLSFNGVVSVLKAVDERLDALAKKSNALGNATKDLAANASPEVVKAVSKQAADMGVKPSEAMGYAGAMAAMFGEEGMKKAMPHANKLRKMGMQGEDIANIGAAASAKDIDFETAAASAGMAARDSRLSPKEFAQAAPAWIEYTDARTGMAASTALAAAGVAPGSLMDRTKDLSLGLKMESDLKKKAEKAAGGAGEYAALSEVEMLAVMKSIIPDLDNSGNLSQGEVQKAGISEQQKAQSIAMAANKLDLFRQESAALMQAKPEVLDEIIAEQERDPTVAGANRAEAASARAEYFSGYGRTADAARANAAQKQDLGRKYMAAGVPMGWDVETGEATPTGRAAAAGMDIASHRPVTGSYAADMGLRGFGMLAKGAGSMLIPDLDAKVNAVKTGVQVGGQAASALTRSWWGGEGNGRESTAQTPASQPSNLMTEDTGKKIVEKLDVIAGNTKQEAGTSTPLSPGPARNGGV